MATEALTIACQSGLSLQGDPTNRQPGSLRDCLNFECSQEFGYSLCGGWARYDGLITAEELLDFFYVGYSFNGIWNAIDPRYGEQLNITLTQPGGGLSVTVKAICLGLVYADSRNNWLGFAYTNPSISQRVAIQGSICTQILGAISGLVYNSGTNKIYQTGIYDDTSDVGLPQPATQALQPVKYGSMLANIASAHKDIVVPVPGNLNSPPDSVFLLNDTTYCTHDCAVYNFANGVAVGVNSNIPLEGHAVRSAGLELGKILMVKTTGGSWGAGTATGYIVAYDDGGVMPVNGATLTLYTADDVTSLGNFAVYVAAGSVGIKPSNTRSLIYSTKDQSVGSGATRMGITRVPLTREIQYTQAYSGQPTGIGFGPSPGVPFSIYEYSRQGLTVSVATLVPIGTGTGGVAQTIGCTNATSAYPWVNINNIKVNDAAFAVSPALPNKTKYISLDAQQFAFSDKDGNALPAATIITGITVTVQEKAISAAHVQDYQVLLIDPDGVTHWPGPLSLGKPNSFTIPVLSTLYTYGGANDVWGRNGWTLADVTAANFGVHLQWQNISNDGTNPTVSVDYVGVQITYLPQTRVVYIRNSQAAAPTDVPALVVHYTTDANTSFTNSNATGTLTLYTTTTEYGFTAAGKTRTVGAGEQIRDAPGGGGQLLGWTAGTDYPISLPAGAALDTASSSWEWITENFYSDPNAQMAFGANGVEYAVGFDQKFLVRIRTGRRVDLDNPRHVFAYYSTLHLGYNTGDVLTSGAGPRPLTVSASQLSQAYNVGQPVVGFANLMGQTLAVFCPRKVQGLQGTNPTNYTQTTLSPALGAFEYTVANVEGQAVWLSYRGVETMDTTNAYGNFKTLPLSAEASPWLQKRLQGDSRIGIQNQRPVGAIGVRSKRQYRAFFADGFTFSLSLFGAQSIPVCTVGFNSIKSYPAVARNVFQGVRSDGKEVLYACWEVVNANYQRWGDLSHAGGAVYPYMIRLDQGYLQDFDSPVFAALDFNPIYPASLNDKLTPIDNCDFKEAWVLMSALVPGQSYITLYSQSDSNKFADIPQVRSNPLAYGGNGSAIQGNGPGYPFDNNVAGVSGGAGQQVTFGPGISNVYLSPLPLLQAVGDLIVQGHFLKLFIDASELMTYSGSNYINVSKVVITYTTDEQSRN